MPDPGEEPELIETPELIPLEEPVVLEGEALTEATEQRVEFEKGMSYFPILVVTIIGLNIVVFIWQFLTGLASPHIANWAHLGGLIGGAAAAWFIPLRLSGVWAEANPDRK